MIWDLVYDQIWSIFIYVQTLLVTSQLTIWKHMVRHDLPTATPTLSCSDVEIAVGSLDVMSMRPSEGTRVKGPEAPENYKNKSKDNINSFSFSSFLLDSPFFLICHG